MSTQRKKKKKTYKKASIDHFCHQVGVSGVGFSKDKKKTIPRKKKYKDDE